MRENALSQRYLYGTRAGCDPRHIFAMLAVQSPETHSNALARAICRYAAMPCRTSMRSTRRDAAAIRERASSLSKRSVRVCCKEWAWFWDSGFILPSIRQPWVRGCAYAFF